MITGAAGAVGSHVGQIAKIKGCYVIGITGSDEKGNVLVNDLGFDRFINYKTTNIAKALAEYAPEGIDCFFDNVSNSEKIVYQYLQKFATNPLVISFVVCILLTHIFTQQLPISSKWIKL